MSQSHGLLTRVLHLQSLPTLKRYDLHLEKVSPLSTGRVFQYQAEDLLKSAFARVTCCMCDGIRAGFYQSAKPARMATLIEQFSTLRFVNLRSKDALLQPENWGTACMKSIQLAQSMRRLWHSTTSTCGIADSHTHSPLRVIWDMAKNTSVTGIKINDLSPNSAENHPASATGKSARLPLNSDICGPMSMSSIQGTPHAMPIVDDHSSFFTLFFIERRDIAPDLIMEGIQSYETRIGAKVATIQADNAASSSVATWKRFWNQSEFVCRNRFRWGLNRMGMLREWTEFWWIVHVLWCWMLDFQPNIGSSRWRRTLTSQIDFHMQPTQAKTRTSFSLAPYLTYHTLAFLVVDLCSCTWSKTTKVRSKGNLLHSSFLSK